MRLYKLNAEMRINLELIYCIRLREVANSNGMWVVEIQGANQELLWFDRFSSKGIAEGFADNIMLAANKGRNEP
jgi:hypothetical protein